MFKISFKFLDKTFSATVQVIEHQPVNYIVYGFVPSIRVIPERLVYESSPQKDQLIYKSFNISEEAILRNIGDAIFWSCHDQKIDVHTGKRRNYGISRESSQLRETVLRRVRQ